MKRRLTRLVVFLLLGAIVGICTTVAVSWLCALTVYMGPDGSRSSAVTSASLPSAEVLVLEAPGALRAYSNFVGRPGLQNEENAWLQEIYEADLRDYVEIVGVDPNLPPHWSLLQHLDPNKYQEVCDDGRGWPFLAMSSAVITPYHKTLSLYDWLKTDGDKLQQFVERGIVISPFSGNDPGMYRTRILPLRPIWKGFVIDATFYALAWCFVYAFFHTLSQHLRTRRQSCPECGYKLLERFEQGCPECGWGREGSDEPEG